MKSVSKKKRKKNSSNFSRKMGITISAVLLLVAVFTWIFWYLALPWNLAFEGIWFLVWLMSVPICFLIKWWLPKEQAVLRFVLSWSWVLFLGIWLLVVSLNGPLGSARKFVDYSNRHIEVIEDSSEASAFPDLFGKDNDASNIPLYGEAEALKKAETEMGKNPGLGSQYELHASDITSQSIDGKLCYVIPLQPKSLFKWDSKEGNHGYFIVDRNTGVCSFMEESLYTTTRAPFGSSTLRIMRSYLREAGISYGLIDISPEVDDEGVFHYVGSLTTQDAPGRFAEIYGVIDLNTETKEMNVYATKDAPSYIDRIYPESLFRDYVSYYGSYQKGYWNSKIQKKGVQEMTAGMDVIYIDGICYYYSGITSSGKDESSSGIMMMNSRTGEMKLHKIYGNSEEKAQGIAQGKIQEKGYKAAYPLLLKVNGEESYFMIMRDNKKNLVGYSFVSYKNSAIAAFGSTVKEAQATYIEQLAKSSSAEDLKDENRITVSGSISAISSEVVNGTTLYYIRIDEAPQIYAFYSEVCPEIVFAQVGASIMLTHANIEATVINAAEVELNGNGNYFSEEN